MIRHVAIAALLVGLAAPAQATKVFVSNERGNTVFHLPKKGGRSRHGLPVRAIHNTASTNSRLSFAVTPTVSSRPGKRPSIFSHWSSRNPYRLTIRRPLLRPRTE